MTTDKELRRERRRQRRAERATTGEKRKREKPVDLDTLKVLLAQRAQNLTLQVR